MRYVILACLIGLTLTCVLLATASDRELESFDPYHPGTLLPILAGRLHALPTFVSDLVDAFTAPYRERMQQQTTLPSDPR